MIPRRRFLSALAALAALPARAQPARPNVLVFMSDQESALLPGPVRLPNRRRIENGGASFSHAFCNTPQCSAARAALVTGREPHHTGVLTNVDGSSLGAALPASMPNVGSVFQAAGYSTGYFGKWHLGGSATIREFGFGAYRAGSDEDAARAASEWIREQRGPWLAWVSLLNPHHIYELPKPLGRYPVRPGVTPPASGLAGLAGKPAEQRQYVDEDQGRATKDFTPSDWLRYRSYYCDLVEKVDKALGAVLDAAGNLDSTVAVYTTDHGDALGEHGLPFKGPFMYEELIRIPLVIRAPGLAAGVRDELVTQTDLAPTLADLAGVRWPGPVDGRNLSKPHEARDAVFLEYYAKQKWTNPIRTVRTRAWKLNWYDRGAKELYDLAADPHELNNLAGKPAAKEMQTTLEARLNAWRGPLLTERR
jgi:arylsulfatase A-like enzyme